MNGTVQMTLTKMLARDIFGKMKVFWIKTSSGKWTQDTPSNPICHMDPSDVGIQPGIKLGDWDNWLRD